MASWTRTHWLSCAALAALGGACAAEAHADRAGAALSRGAGQGSIAARDRDDDVDERTDEANDRDGDSDETPGDEIEVPIDQLPAAVRATVEREVGAGTITGIDRDLGPAGPEYEVDFARDGVE